MNMEKYLNVDLLVATAVGALLYFAFEFKAKKFAWADFSPWFWIKDNWFNLVLTVVCLWACMYLEWVKDKGAAAVLGFSWNKVVDYVQDFFTKKQLPDAATV